MSKTLERFLKYAKLDTQSHMGATESPSNPKELTLIGWIRDELTMEFGVPDELVLQLGDGSLLVNFPPTEGYEKALPGVFASHVDTYFGCPGGANPMQWDYIEGDILLPNNGIIIPARTLAGLEGKRIITADGTTLLGADDKAGVSALMTFIEGLLIMKVNHGPLWVWFCVDEETGKIGIKHLPEGLATKWRYFCTADGVGLDTIDVGCFYGAKLIVKFIGNDAHPGVQGEELFPAHYAASRLLDSLGSGPSPWTTSGEESFIYSPALPSGDPGETIVTLIPRSFNPEEFPGMRELVLELAVEAAGRFPGVKCDVSEIIVEYVSTEEAITANPEILNVISRALQSVGVTTVHRHRIRAGTDGAMLNKTYPKIPAPNLGVGGRNLHGVREFLVVDEMVIMPDILLEMVREYAKMTV